MKRTIRIATVGYNNAAALVGLLAKQSDQP